jgi:predicted HTH domain antitoxin
MCGPEFPPHGPVQPIRTPEFSRLDPVRDRELLPLDPERRVHGREFLRLDPERRVRGGVEVDAAGDLHELVKVRCYTQIDMNSLKIPYPSEVLWALQKEPDEFEAEARLLLALKLYETGKLSTGLAAKLAGVPRVTFLFLLGQHGLSPFGEEPDELERDLANARQARRPQ